MELRRRDQNRSVLGRVVVTIGIMGLAGACATAPKSAPERVALNNDADSTLKAMEAKDPTVGELVEDAHAHAVFPSVGKAGAVVGGAFGRGIVYQGDEPIGYTQVSQASIGAQLGAQSYSELILFRDAKALEKFQTGQFKPGASASGVIATSGGARAADFDRGGTAVLVMPEGGLMFDVSLNGQKFNYKKMVDEGDEVKTDE